jgi:hypothetical protein
MISPKFSSQSSVPPEDAELEYDRTVTNTKCLCLVLELKAVLDEPPSLSIYLWLYSPCGLWPLFHNLDLYTVGRTPWTGDQPVTRPQPTHRTPQTQNKCTQTAMPWLGLEPTTPVFEGEKTVHALDRAAIVIGTAVSRHLKYRMAVESEHDCEIVLLKASKIWKNYGTTEMEIIFSCISLDNYRYHINGDHFIRTAALCSAFKNSVT